MSLRPTRGGWREEVDRLDVAVYSAVAATPTPRLDVFLRRVSSAADHSKLWIGTAAVLGLAGGRRGRRAAVNGLASTALSSAVVNLVLKPLADRRRPDRPRYQVRTVRHVSMPGSTSFPSGHAASAAAFATGVASTLPQIGIPLGAAGALVAYSRVHTGVHYPADVIAGSVAGTALAQLAVAAVEGGRGHRPTRTSTSSPIELS